MKPAALLSQSFGSIWGNKIRSSLTILGIVIGIAAVIALVGLGNGLQESVVSRFGDLGSTKITVISQDPERQTADRSREGSGGGGGMRTPGSFSFSSTSQESLTEADYLAVKEMEGVASSSPVGTSQLDVTLTGSADKATAFQVYGVGEEYMEIQEYSLASGEFLSPTQVSGSESVVVVGQQAAEDLFGAGQDPLGKVVYIKDKPFTVVGVLAEPESQSSFGGGGTGSPADNIYTGYRSWLTLSSKDKYGTLVASAASEEAVQGLADGIEGALLSSHGITDENKADVAVSTSDDLLETMSSVTGSFSATLTAIAAISLLVGGIGIMNIMLVTVTERTREIGLRRAVGAKTRHVIAQFLTESVLLTLVGGGLGLLLALGFSRKAASLISFGPARGSDVAVIVDARTVLLALSVSAAIGIVFGLFPAVKAARLDPVEALRYE